MSVSTVGDALVARLVATVQAAGLVRKVYPQRDYAAVPAASMLTPSLAVIYTGYTPGARIPNTGVQEVQLGWLVVVNIRNARNSASGEGVQDEASPVFDAVMEALLGFRPVAKFTPLQLEPAPGAALEDPGFGYYPLAFSTKTTYRPTP